MARVALVLEGGSFRSVFTSGVLDVLMERGVWGFTSVWGVSAGALVGTNFVSRQPGRSIRINLAYRDDVRYMSPYQLAKTGNIMSTTFLYDDVQNELDPFDFTTFNANPCRLMAAVSDVVMGQPVYVEIDKLPQKTDYLRASSSLPMVSQVVPIDGRRYLDGGISDAVPVERALLEPDADRAVVVLTRERDYVKPPVSGTPAFMAQYSDYPYFLKLLLNRHERYNAQREVIWQLERDGRALVISPPVPVEVSSVVKDGAKLLDLYIQGRHAAETAMSDLARFMA